MFFFNDFNVVVHVFLFPRKDVNAYVMDRGMPSLSALTACFWMKSADTINRGAPLSYAVPAQANEFVVFEYKSFILEITSEQR